MSRRAYAASKTVGRIGLAALLCVFALMGESRAQSGDVAAYKRAVEQRFAAWLEALWPEAEAKGVSR